VREKTPENGEKPHGKKVKREKEISSKKQPGYSIHPAPHYSTFYSGYSIHPVPLCSTL